MAEIVDDVNCPMLKKEIELGYCIELQWIVDGGVKPTKDEKFLTQKHYEICRNCKKRIDPSL